MGKKHFLYVLSLLFVTAGLAGNPTQVYAANGRKPANTKKERLVLMPLRVGETDKSRQAAMETALVEGLQQKYEVFSGEQVTQKAHEIFMKESKTAHKDCDETRCMQGIAEAFQAELIATANVSRQEDGYFLALSIQNIFDNKVVYSKSTPCKNCDAYQVVDKLKELNGTTAQSPNQEISSVQSSDAFDGRWSVTLVCDDVRDNGALVKGYTYLFVANIKHGRLEAQYKKAGYPGSVTYIGQVQRDGTVEIMANGQTGNSEYTMGHATKGTPYAYLLKGNFSESNGHATRTAVRPCEAYFSRQ
jgi:deoxycytidylate deaminase